ncbi:MAG: hypothetical protein ACT4NV_07860 [Rhodoferax sp.]
MVQTLQQLVQAAPTPRLVWLAENRRALETAVGLPLAMTAVAAVAFLDLGFSAPEGEMLYLLCRLPGAAAHALEQATVGFKQFPFYELEVDPSIALPSRT